MLVNLFDLIERNNHMISSLTKVFLGLFRFLAKVLKNSEKIPFKLNLRQKMLWNLRVSSAGMKYSPILPTARRRPSSKSYSG